MSKRYTDEEILIVVERQITALKRILAKRLEAQDPYALDQVGALKQLAASMRQEAPNGVDERPNR